MGQYYKPINLDKKQFVLSHEYNNGLKLMEHSYVDNQFVGAVEALIAEGGAWHGDRIVWAGDYADNEKRRKNNLYGIVSAKDSNKVNPIPVKKSHRYVINLDTKEFVDIKKVPLSYVYVDEAGEVYPFTIHPLPLLTCEGNGRGGGDFHKDDPIVGKWARARVTVSNKKPKGYKEIDFNLYEGDLPAQMPEKNKKAVTV